MCIVVYCTTFDTLSADLHVLSDATFEQGLVLAPAQPQEPAWSGRGMQHGPCTAATAHTPQPQRSEPNVFSPLYVMYRNPAPGMEKSDYLW